MGNVKKDFKLGLAHLFKENLTNITLLQQYALQAGSFGKLLTAICDASTRTSLKNEMPGGITV